MEKNKCSSTEHKEIEAKSFCQKCRIFMCNKCEKIHLEFYKDHQLYNLDKDIKNIFTGFCKEQNHINELIYFCRTHNKLCCAECITKLKGKNNGIHSDCDICFIEDVEQEKKNKLKDNIKCLENLSISLQNSIEEIKKVFQKISENKENLKIKIQKMFTNLRNEINKREDELMLEIEKKFNNSFSNEDLIKKIEKLPSKVKVSLEKGKIIENKWNDNKLNSLLNDCLNIENDIK